MKPVGADAPDMETQSREGAVVLLGIPEKDDLFIHSPK